MRFKTTLNEAKEQTIALLKEQIIGLLCGVELVATPTKQ